MVRQHYPLEALRKLRDERADEQARRLAEQVALCQQALTELLAREALVREHERRTAEILRVERERLDLAGATGSELARLVDFGVAASVQAERLRRFELEARQRLANERAAEDKLRRELTALEAEAELVRNHEADFQQRETEVAQKADEEAALEQWNARRH